MCVWLDSLRGLSYFFAQKMRDTVVVSGFDTLHIALNR
jgi:hypothetical protein